MHRRHGAEVVAIAVGGELSLVEGTNVGIVGVVVEQVAADGVAAAEVDVGDEIDMLAVGLARPLELVGRGLRSAERELGGTELAAVGAQGSARQAVAAEGLRQSEGTLVQRLDGDDADVAAAGADVRCLDIGRALGDEDIVGAL